MRKLGAVQDITFPRAAILLSDARPICLNSESPTDDGITWEIALTDQQKKAPEQLSTTVKLILIDAGESGLKSYVRLQSPLDSNPFDRNAFNQKLDTASAAVSRLVKDVGDMALTVRTTLTTEQWRKLEAMKTSRRTSRHPHPEPRGDAMPDYPRFTLAPSLHTLAPSLQK